MSRPPRMPDALHTGMRQGQRAQHDARSPTVTNGASQKGYGRMPDALENTQSRAARFEDEKRRIIESVFARKDDDGVQVESYITHVRVVEDAMYPTTPPPPDADQSNKKNRVILVAVRRSGRVRVHKARENPNSSFSIGKTWNLDELGSIQSYTNLIPRSNQEQLEKQWADGIGFVVTLGKAYYWQAPTAKEKDFFIASLVKIFRKYTGGKIPELYGFSSEEIESLSGGLPLAQSNSDTHVPATPDPASTASIPPPIPPASELRPQSPYKARSQGSDFSREAAPQLKYQSRNETPPPRGAQRTPPEPVRSPARNKNMNMPEPGPPPPLFATGSRPSPSPQSSQTSLPSTERPSGGYFNGLPARPKAPFADSDRNTPSVHSVTSRPSTAVSEQKSLESKSEQPFSPAEASTERRNQLKSSFESGPASQTGVGSETESQFATPAITPSDLHATSPAKTFVEPNSGSQSRKNELSKDNIEKPEDSERLGPVSPSEQSSANTSQVTSPLSDKSVTPKEEYRPGLGPMIKKKSAKDIAGQFRKAAMAAGAFQPRQGGGAARLKALQDKENASNANGPDGITGVVPAPLFRGLKDDKTASSPSTPLQASFPDRSPVPSTGTAQTDATPSVVLERTATKDSPLSPPTPSHTTEKVTASSTLSAVDKPKSEKREQSPDKARSRSPQRRKRQRQQNEIAKYCSSLGIDSRVLDGRGADFNDLLTEFGWQGRLKDERKLEDFEGEIKREIGRAQATGWLGHVEQQEGKVQDLAKAFDKAIEECEELDGLFTLYSHELETLAADIEYIEAQSQGLQVQTANQKLLQKELHDLLQTLTIPSSELRGLQSDSLDTNNGIEKVEKSLALLYKALLTIDPDIRQNKVRQANGAGADRNGVGVYADSEIGQMRAVREKKDGYREETMSFVKRLNRHMTAMFDKADFGNSDDTARTTLSSIKISESKVSHNSRQDLWVYNALMLFVREVNNYEWQTMISSYEIRLKHVYQNQFRDFNMARRRTVHKPSGEELEVLFTTQEKEKAEEGLASTAARKLTVRRGKNPRTGNLKQNPAEKRDGKPEAWEVFDGILQSQAKIIAEEQNFIVHFFHLNSQSSADFAELIHSKAPSDRILPNLNAKQSYDPDRSMAKIVQSAVEAIYHFWLADVQSLVEWSLNLDQMQGVGILRALEQRLAAYEETNQEYITRTLRALHDRLVGLFHKFVDEQVKAIEDTKVKIKKRKGVISFMRVFPIFSSTIENMLPSDIPQQDSLEVRFIVNESYGKILKAMWESINFIAKDDPTVGSAAVHSNAPTTGDPEDKEALNYHILLIENMAHYIDEVDTHRNVILEEWTERAKQDLATHLGQYVDSVVRRPLGKWLDFIESTEAMMRNNDSTSGISSKPSHSRGAAKKVLSAHDAKEIRKGVDTLKKRIEKHFGDVDDPSPASKRLILLVFEECSARYGHAWDRMKTIIDTLYEANLEIDWKKEEMQASFKLK